jgi:hypothetical protein
MLRAGSMKANEVGLESIISQVVISRTSPMLRLGSDVFSFPLDANRLRDMVESDFSNDAEVEGIGKRPREVVLRINAVVERASEEYGDEGSVGEEGRFRSRPRNDGDKARSGDKSLDFMDTGVEGRVTASPSVSRSGRSEWCPLDSYMD